MKKTLIATLMFVFPFVLSGQTLDDAKDLYNKGARYSARTRTVPSFILRIAWVCARPLAHQPIHFA